MSAAFPLKIGVALGGGVARGLAHLGVLQAFEQAQIPIDLVSGSSAGAIIGAAYCAGLGLDRLCTMAAKLRWSKIAHLVWPKRGVLSFEPLADWLRGEIGDIHFHQLQIPFAVSCVDLITGTPQILCEGSVIRAVQASCSVPGVAVPVEMGEMLLADGNFADAVPIKALHCMGAGYTIGVDIMQPALRRKLGFVGFGLTGLEILLQRIGDGVDLADCVIQPRLAGESYVRFSQFDRFVQCGREAAEAKLPEILAALASLSEKPADTSAVVTPKW